MPFVVPQGGGGMEGHDNAPLFILENTGQAMLMNNLSIQTKALPTSADQKNNSRKRPQHQEEHEQQQEEAAQDQDNKRRHHQGKREKIKRGSMNSSYGVDKLKELALSNDIMLYQLLQFKSQNHHCSIPKEHQCYLWAIHLRWQYYQLKVKGIDPTNNNNNNRDNDDDDDDDDDDFIHHNLLTPERFTRVSLMVYPMLARQCVDLRSKIQHVSTKSKGSNVPSTRAAPWIPELSKLCGLIVDMITFEISQIDDSTCFTFQGYSNMLWAAAKLRRTDSKLMANAVENLIKLTEMHTEIKNENEMTPQAPIQKVQINSQDIAYSLWSFAKSSTFGPDEQQIHLTVKLIVSYPSIFLHEAKSQEVSTTIWSTATLLSKRPSLPSEETNIAALTIMRCISKEVIKRHVADFSSQMVANIAWTDDFNDNDVNLQSVSSTSNDTIIISINSNKDNYSTTDHQLVSEVIKTLVKRGNGISQNCNPQAFCNVAWTMARLD